MNITSRGRSHRRGLDAGLHLLQTDNILTSPSHTPSEHNTHPSEVIFRLLSPLQILILRVFFTLSSVSDSGSSSTAFPTLARFPTAAPAQGPMEVRCHTTQAAHKPAPLLRRGLIARMDAVPHPALPGPRSQRFQHARVQVLHKVASRL